MPMMARSKLYLCSMLVAGLLLTGCSSDSTSPKTAAPKLSQSKSSPFVPSAAAKALIGVADGTYEFTIDPTVDQAVNLGPNHLGIPANAICDIATSSYGADHWNESCAPQTEPVRVTAIVRNAASDHPSIDFYPAMRFAPDKSVNLYIYVPVGMDDFQKNWKMKYCNDEMFCADESLTDSDLGSFVDRDNTLVFRRIKHFSGYWVQGYTEENEEQSSGMY